MNFNESQTKQNLARLFAGECQDGARYQFIAKCATTQGFSYLADTMKMLAKHEMAHAGVIYDLLLNNGGGKMENIEISAGYPFEDYQLESSFNACSGAELSQAKNIYPHFAKIALDEGFKDISNSLKLIAEVEYMHSQILAEMDKKYNAKKLYKSSESKKWTCSNCGHTHTLKEAWKECPLCNYPQGYVIVNFESMN